jgi:hypothetical protein
VHPVYVLGLVVLTLEGPLMRRVANDAEPWQSISEWLTTWVV